MTRTKATKEQIQDVRLFVFGTCELHEHTSRLIIRAEISFLFDRYTVWSEQHGKPPIDRIVFRKCLKKNFPRHVQGKDMRFCAPLKPRCWTDGTIRAVWDGRYD